MKQSNICFIILISLSTLTSCEQTCEDKTQQDHPVLVDLIDSLTIENILVNECTTYLPNGINDSLILGYRYDSNGIFHDVEMALTSLKIIGLKFENFSFSNFEYYYLFKFENKDEKLAFSDFKKFSSKYLDHSKLQPKYFLMNHEVFLRIKPMP